MKVHPSPAYTMTNVPVYQNDITDTFLVDGRFTYNIMTGSRTTIALEPQW